MGMCASLGDRSARAVKGGGFGGPADPTPVRYATLLVPLYNIKMFLSMLFLVFIFPEKENGFLFFTSM